MKFSANRLDSIPVHFILCTERSGSSLLSLMLNLHSSIICPSEEPFALYFYRRYKNKTKWSDNDIHRYVNDFFVLADKNLDLYFSSKDRFLNTLLEHKNILNYHRLMKITYLHFFDVKEKKDIEVIVDKQIKYFFHLTELQKIFPKSKFLILTRDVRDNVVSKKNRALNWSQHPMFLAYLWKDTYRNMHCIQKDKKKIITYEDLVKQTEETLRAVCSWFNVSFQSEMLETENKFKSLVEVKKNQLDPAFYEKLLLFHEGLSEKPNTNKIGQYKQFDTKTIAQLEAICEKELDLFGYKRSRLKTKTFILKKLFFQFLSKCYRSYLLKFYLAVPLEIKLVIRRLKKKKVSA